MMIKERIYKYITDNSMISAKDRVCVGLSGGADSIFLLQILYELKERLDVTLSAFHVNHCLRGDESESDQKITQQFCDDRGIELHVFRYDILKISNDMKKGTEETGRIMRQQAAKECVEKNFADKIALAHHINDRAETVIFNLARGSSLSGIKGIAPVNGYIIRPLLSVSRNEIEGELIKRNIKWCTDSTNLKEEYTRNKVRLNIIPYLEENINAGSVKHICGAADDILEADEIIRRIALSKAEKITKKIKQAVLIKTDIADEKRLIAGYILMDALKSITGTAVDLTRGHINDIIGLAEKQCGRKIDLPYDTFAERTYEGIRISKKTCNNAENQTESLVLNTDGINDFNDTIFRCRIIDSGFSYDDIPKKTYTKWFDYDKISRECCLRYRRSGDYITTDPELHKKKLKEYFIDNKIPKELRDKVVCLADGQKIIWIVGYRISEEFKVSESTKRVLEIEAHITE